MILGSKFHNNQYIDILMHLGFSSPKTIANPNSRTTQRSQNIALEEVMLIADGVENW